MRALVPLVALATLACSAAPEEAPAGVLWEHRDQLAAALEFRRGPLSAMTGSKIVPCLQYWISGNEADAQETVETCELRRRQVRADFAAFLDRPVNDADVRDSRFWRYVAERARL